MRRDVFSFPSEQPGEHILSLSFKSHLSTYTCATKNVVYTHSYINIHISQSHFTCLLADTIMSDMVRHYMTYKSHKNVVKSLSMILIN